MKRFWEILFAGLPLLFGAAGCGYFEPVPEEPLPRIQPPREVKRLDLDGALAMGRENSGALELSAGLAAIADERFKSKTLLAMPEIKEQVARQPQDTARVISPLLDRAAAVNMIFYAAESPDELYAPRAAQETDLATAMAMLELCHAAANGDPQELTAAAMELNFRCNIAPVKFEQVDFSGLRRPYRFTPPLRDLQFFAVAHRPESRLTRFPPDLAAGVMEVCRSEAVAAEKLIRLPDELARYALDHPDCDQVAVRKLASATAVAINTALLYSELQRKYDAYLAALAGVEKQPGDPAAALKLENAGIDWQKSYYRLLCVIGADISRAAQIPPAPASPEVAKDKNARILLRLLH